MRTRVFYSYAAHTRVQTRTRVSKTHTRKCHGGEEAPLCVSSPAEPGTSPTTTPHHVACVLSTALCPCDIQELRRGRLELQLLLLRATGHPHLDARITGSLTRSPWMGIPVGPPCPRQHWNGCFLHISAYLCK